MLTKDALEKIDIERFHKEIERVIRDPFKFESNEKRLAWQVASIKYIFNTALSTLLQQVGEENKKAYKWIVSKDTGISSVTIWSVMMGVTPGWAGTPSDEDDYGRCYRLLQLIPEWQTRLDEVTKKYPDWKEHIEHIRSRLDSVISEIKKL